MIILQRVYNWTLNNSLTLNVNKTHAMFISASNSSPDRPVLMLNNLEIDYVQSALSLGFRIQSNLEWDTFLTQQCGKIYGKLRTLQLTASFLSTDTKLKLFKSLIFPYFISCDFIIMQGTSFALNRLRIALNACVRYVFNLSRFSHVSHLQHRLIGCSFDSFCKMRCCQLVFKLISNKKPDYLYSKLTPFRSIRSKKFVLPRHRTSKYGNSFFVRGVSFWNSLPNEITLIKQEAAFRRKCIEHLS